MIVLRRGAELLLVTQPDHAHLAAELLALRRHGGVLGHARRDDILVAVREHDNGWREADAAPRLDPRNGRPCDFRDYPDGAREEVWLRGVERFAESRPYAALLIAEHGLAVHRDRAGEVWKAFLDRLTAARDELASRSGAEPEIWQEDYRFLAWADAAALAAVGVWPRFELELGRGEERAGKLHLDPFPYAGATHFTFGCRRIPDREYQSALDLAATMAESRWLRASVGVSPW